MAKKRAAKWRAWNKGIELGQKDKAPYILNGTGDTETVGALLGDTKIASTARYLRLS